MYYGENLKRGDIIFCNLGNNKVGSVQSGSRYCLVISNDQGNRTSTTLEIAPFTSSTTKKNLPCHIDVEGFGLKKPSTLLLEQITTISLISVDRRVGHIDDEDLLREIDLKILKQLGIDIKKLIK